MFAKAILFFQETRREFKRINWPTFAETRRLTFIVIGMSLATALFLGVLDFAFTSILQQFIF
ncbi:MAG: preprotein translocase subunit SecE [Patescibacteria group bacterium]